MSSLSRCCEWLDGQWFFGGERIDLRLALAWEMLYNQPSFPSMSKRRNKKRPHAVPVQSREKPQAAEQPRPSSKLQGLTSARVLLAVSLAIAVYLAWVSFKGGSLPGCGPESGCNKVLQSRWSHWFGLPVSVPAALVYVSLLWATFQIGSGISVARQRACWRGIVALSVVIVGAAIWFVGLQALVIKSFCPFCMTAHASAVIAAFLLLRNVPLQAAAVLTEASRRPDSSWALARPEVFKFGLAGAAALGVLLAGPYVVQKKQYAVKTGDGISQTTPTLAAPGARGDSAGASAATESQTVSINPVPDGQATAPGQPAITQASPPTPPLAKAEANAGASIVPTAPRREVVLHQGKHRLLVDELPIIGAPTAPHLMVSLFDYTCHYCRDMHGLLLEAQRRFSNQLAIVSLPMPLDSDCNHLVKRTPSAHANACQYAKFGLAVWRARPEAFSEFDSWLFHPPSPLPLNEVKQRAEELVGREKLEQALADDWVKKQLQTAVAIYESNSSELRDGRMPQLVIGSAISVGPLQKIDQLYTMLADQLGLKAP
ncbi:MAG: thioredoxin domain-containing protein [Verrucomicrobia bacterium]|nr:thioredoxin domain-containing protein [Verrucomicrobiota bacterium]